MDIKTASRQAAAAKRAEERAKKNFELHPNPRNEALAVSTRLTFIKAANQLLVLATPSVDISIDEVVEGLSRTPEFQEYLNETIETVPEYVYETEEV